MLPKEDLSSAENLRAYQSQMKKLLNLEKFAFVEADGLIYTAQGTSTEIGSYAFDYASLSGPEISVRDAESADKTVVIAVPEECSSECREFFTIKLSLWPTEPAKARGWPWMDFTRPQRVFPNLKGEPECINVSVAQHPQLRFGDSVLYGETGNCGRAFHGGRNDPAPDAWTKGYNFSEQFERALDVRAPVTLVTGGPQLPPTTRR